MSVLIRISYKSLNFEVFNDSDLYQKLMSLINYNCTTNSIKTDEEFKSIRVYDKYFNFLIKEIHNEEELNSFGKIFLTNKKIISIIGSSKHYTEYTKTLCNDIISSLKKCSKINDFIFLTGGTTGIPADITREFKDQTFNIIPEKEWDYIVDDKPVYSDNGALFYKLPIKLDQRSYLLGTLCDDMIMCSGSIGSFYEFLSAFLRDKKLFLFPDIENSPSHKFLKMIKENDYSLIKDYESDIEKYIYDSCNSEFYNSLMNISEIVDRPSFISTYNN